MDLPTIPGIKLRQILGYDQLLFKHAIDYVLTGKRPENQNYDDAISVPALDTISKNLDRRPIAKSYRFGKESIDPVAVRFRDWRSAVQTSRPSVDKSRHALRLADGSIGQHIEGNLQLVDVLYNMTKGNYATTLQMDLVMYAILVRNCGAVSLSRKRVGEILVAVASELSRLQPASVVMSAIGSLNQDQLEASEADLGKLSLGDPLPLCRGPVSVGRYGPNSRSGAPSHAQELGNDDTGEEDVLSSNESGISSDEDDEVDSRHVRSRSTPAERLTLAEPFISDERSVKCLLSFCKDLFGAEMEGLEKTALEGLPTLDLFEQSATWKEVCEELCGSLVLTNVTKLIQYSHHLQSKNQRRQKSPSKSPSKRRTTSTKRLHTCSLFTTLYICFAVSQYNGASQADDGSTI
ncbi:unnamed protein product [Sympodiomycopsis kandeliae]